MAIDDIFQPCFKIGEILGDGVEIAERNLWYLYRIAIPWEFAIIIDMVLKVRNDLALPKGHLCRRIEVKDSGFTVYSKVSENDQQWEIVGAASFDTERVLDMRQSLTIFLTEKQSVFIADEMMPGRNMLGPWIKTIAKTGRYTSNDSTASRIVSAEMVLNRATITGVYDGLIVPDVLDYR